MSNGGLSRLRGKIISFLWPEKGLPCMYHLGRRCSSQSCSGYYPEPLNYGFLDRNNNPVCGHCLLLAGESAVIHSLGLFTQKAVREMVRGTIKDAFREVSGKL